MKNHPQYIVIYRDSTRARNRYYGPFISETMAERFVDCLPEPQQGGQKLYRLIRPFTFEECSLATMEIEQVRDLRVA